MVDPKAALARIRAGAQKVPDSQELLNQILGYEIRCASRYRRFTALVLIAVQTEFPEIQAMLSEHLRGCDAQFVSKNTVALLMSETDTAGALIAINRYKAGCKDGIDMRFALASYPTDARDAAEMLATARRRLETARKSPESGAVVASG
jgi:hypothetical protein